jgi:hypothetical protein
LGAGNGFPAVQQKKSCSATFGFLQLPRPLQQQKNCTAAKGKLHCLSSFGGNHAQKPPSCGKQTANVASS